MLNFLKEKYTCMHSFEENIHILLRRKQCGSMKLLTKKHAQLSWKNNLSHFLNIICIENLLKIPVSSSELQHMLLLPFPMSCYLMSIPRHVFIINMKIYDVLDYCLGE